MAKSIVQGRQSQPPDAASDIDAFLEKVRVSPKVGPGNGRLIFGMDATMSRQPTWDSAISIQSQMFVEAAKSGTLAVQLAYFRGFNECKSSKWVTDGKALARLMSTVQCRGGNTQLGRLLTHIKAETNRAKVSAAVYVGDAMEEGIDAICVTAGEIGLSGTPIFMFQEGHDSRAETAFREIARLTGGAYFKLDANSAAQLAEVLRAVAAFAAGGWQALEDRAKADASTKKLIQQMRR